MKNALKIFRKEIKEVIKNRSIWFPILIISLVFAIAFPIVLIISVDYMVKEPDTINFISKIYQDKILISDISKIIITFFRKLKKLFNIVNIILST